MQKQIQFDRTHIFVIYILHVKQQNVFILDFFNLAFTYSDTQKILMHTVY